MSSARSQTTASALRANSIQHFPVSQSDGDDDLAFFGFDVLADPADDSDAIAEDFDDDESDEDGDSEMDLLTDSDDTSTDAVDLSVVPLDPLINRTYSSKSDIISALIQYHHLYQRDYLPKQNDARRYYVKCTLSTCEFHANFNFRDNNFKPPTSSMQHTCEPWLVQTTKRATQALYLRKMPVVREWMNAMGRSANTADLRKVLTQKGLKVEYPHLYNTVRLLKDEIYSSDVDEYLFLDSYVKVLNDKGHRAGLEVDSRQKFKRMFVLYQQGLQVFSQYWMRGLQLDGTFIKNATGGVLLVACVKDGNNSICVVGVSVVSCENEDNWHWFLEKLREHLDHDPAFIISDREKGLIKAVDDIFVGVHHAYCFRHIMENFNRKFKDQQLRKLAAKLVRAETEHEFQATSRVLKQLNANAMAWLEAVGFEKITLLRSPVCKYGTLTSNNVESFNARIRQARALPVLSLLLEIEKFAVLDRFNRHRDSSSSSWQSLTLTLHAVKMLRARSADFPNLTSMQSGEQEYIITRHARDVTEYQVSLAERGSCSCGHSRLYGLPCAHILFASRESRQAAENYCNASWLKSVYQQAYANLARDTPLTIRSTLVRGETLPPPKKKPRGRPKRKRNESQQATLDLDREASQVQKKPRKPRRCGTCKATDHDSRNHDKVVRARLSGDNETETRTENVVE
jgi:hypothetical protein